MLPGVTCETPVAHDTIEKSVMARWRDLGFFATATEAVRGHLAKSGPSYGQWNTRSSLHSLKHRTPVLNLRVLISA